MCHDALNAAKQKLKDLMEQHEKYKQFNFIFTHALVSFLLDYISNSDYVKNDHVLVLL